jgi:hypothetical protein
MLPRPRCSGDPGRPPRGVQQDLPVPGRVIAVRRSLRRSLPVATKKKPEPTDEAREQARRALQTSMDTRQ